LKLPNLLWLGYVNDPAYADFVSWTRRTGIDRPDIGSGYYLTAAALEHGFSKDPPLIEGDDLGFARAILLFAALLPIDEAILLLQTAARLGCSLIAIGLDGHEETFVTAAPSTAAVEFETNVSVSDRIEDTYLPPKLARVGLGSIPESGPISLPSVIDERIRQLTQANEAGSRANTAAANRLNTSFDQFLALSTNQFDELIKDLKLAWNYRASWINLVKSVHRESEELTKEAFRLVGIDCSNWQGIRATASYIDLVRLEEVLGVCCAGERSKVIQAFQPSGRLAPSVGLEAQKCLGCPAQGNGQS
jgi:hypothetical protein